MLRPGHIECKAAGPGRRLRLTRGLFLRTSVESLSAAQGVPLLKKHGRLRAVEVTLSKRLYETVTDAALHVAAKRFGLRERGERLYEHKDCRVLLELATYQHRPRGKTVLEPRSLRKHRRELLNWFVAKGHFAQGATDGRPTRARFARPQILLTRPLLGNARSVGARASRRRTLASIDTCNAARSLAVRRCAAAIRAAVGVRVATRAQIVRASRVCARALRRGRALHAKPAGRVADRRHRSEPTHPSATRASRVGRASCNARVSGGVADRSGRRAIGARLARDARARCGVADGGVGVAGAVRARATLHALLRRRVADRIPSVALAVGSALAADACARGRVANSRCARAYGPTVHGTRRM